MRRVKKMTEKMRCLKRNLGKVRRKLRKESCYLLLTSFFCFFLYIEFILFSVVTILYN